MNSENRQALAIRSQESGVWPVTRHAPGARRGPDRGVRVADDASEQVPARAVGAGTPLTLVASSREPMSSSPGRPRAP